ncbi:MAG: DMT family transporter [Candidatus Aenigmarchaeota archaeon]|nr:DMT family transporter [Candidatus Aenigmarchaeota archaeon]
MNAGSKFAIYSALLIGVSIVFQSQAAKAAEPMLVATYALLISSLILFAVIALRNKKLSYAGKLKNDANFWKIVVSRNVVGTLFLLYGMGMTTAVNSLFILRLEPVFVILFGYTLLNEKVKSREILYVLLTIAGAVLVSTAGSFSFGPTQTGDLLVFASLIALGYSYIPSRRIMQKTDPLVLTAYSNLAGGLILLLLSAAVLDSLKMPVNALVLTLGSVITFYVVGLSLWFKALKKTQAWRVAALLSITPVAGGALSFVWLGESLSLIQLIGAGIILIMSYLLSSERKN